MSTTTIAFLDLTDDVLIRILGFCDIQSVIYISQVNRYLQTITLVKQLWISLVDDLIQRSLLELPPGFVISQHSAAELIDHVKRVTQGARTWRSTPPSTRLVFPVDIKQGYQGDAKVKLVNGGRYFVLSHRTAIEIWDVETKRLLWSRPGSFAHTFSVDPRDPPTTITLAMTSADRYTLKIIQIDKRFGEKKMFNLRLPRFYAHADPIISGNLLVAHMRMNAIGGYETLVVDWVAERYVLLSGLRGSSVPCVGLISGKYLLVVGDVEYEARAANDPPPPPHFPRHIIVYSTAAFERHWNPLSELTSPTQKHTPLAMLVPLVVETPGFDNNINFRNAASVLSVHESPLRPGTFKVRVYLSDGHMRKHARYGTYVPAAVCCYRRQWRRRGTPLATRLGACCFAGDALPCVQLRGTCGGGPQLRGLRQCN
ncbi:hypothetical protein MVEN_02224900 [Mycena venus]|uniref:F-box domain-containing protein n=1 Tax=Mycena venus TaxID=2733690 RepID=A0A8H7CFR9_9AGAR|nr:hypothetical protein MVEN_02224900 [Mycena venus]